MNDRPIAKCKHEILALANHRVPLRIVEIARLTNTIPQVLQKIERRAMDKLRELIDFDVSELIDDELTQARKRRRVMK
jgi:hypothetical protein